MTNITHKVTKEEVIGNNTIVTVLITTESKVMDSSGNPFPTKGEHISVVSFSTTITFEGPFTEGDVIGELTKQGLL